MQRKEPTPTGPECGDSAATGLPARPGDPFVTQGLTAKQAGVAAWEKGALAAGIFLAGVLVAQKNSLGMFPRALQSEGWCGVLKGLSLGHPWGLIVMGRGSCQASGYPRGLTQMFVGPTGREENEGPWKHRLQNPRFQVQRNGTYT